MSSACQAQFVTTHGIPVVSTFMGKGAGSDRLDQSLISIGTGFKDYVMQAVERADLILSVGYDIAEYPPQRWNPKHDKKIVHIDFSFAEVYADYEPEVEVIGDISGTLWELNRQLHNERLKFDTKWYAALRGRIMEDIEDYDLDEGKPSRYPERST